ncbi:MAG: alkaline phosphatase family protein [Gaiellaceae bacterium]
MPATSGARKLVLVVIDGLTPAMFEGAVGDRSAPMLSALAERGSYRRAASVFPSLTPVCLSSIATGAHPDGHEIPHLVWYHRGERRIVEYGSSFGAVRAAGIGRSLRDTIWGLNARHLSPGATTLYEALEDVGRVPAAINITCYRGRTRHLPKVPGLPAAWGPRHFFFYSLFESDQTGAPLAVRNRPAGTVDAYAATVGRWLVTRDAFDALVFYLSDYDYASHTHGPDMAHEALARCDAAIGALLEAAGGIDEFLDRYDLVLCSDHGQTRVEHAAVLHEPFARVEGTLVTASNRAGMVYRLPECREDVRSLAERLDGQTSVDATLFLEHGEPVVRRAGADVPIGELEYPDAEARIRGALGNPNACEVLVSAAAGYEFADGGGSTHVGGGSHGSLLAGDSEVPMLTIGLDEAPASITEVTPAILNHLEVSTRPIAGQE